MEIFRFNRRAHPNDTFWPYLGLARGYSAFGDKRRAITNWEIAIKNIPPALAANRPAFERALRDLKGND
jgi:hypothetical protein